MRQGSSALCTALLLCSTYSVASNEEATSAVDPVAQAYIAVEQVQAQVAESGAELSTIQKAIVSAKKQQTQLADTTAQLELRRSKAKQQLDSDYARMLDEPDLDISKAQAAYQASWQAIKEHQQAALDNQHTITELTQSLYRAQSVQQSNLQALDSATEVHTRARVERLRQEISGSRVTTVSHINTCKQSMTLSECEQQTQTLAVQKAVSEYQNELINNTTELTLVKRHVNGVPLNVHVTGQKMTESQFFGDVKHRSVLDLQLETRPATNAPCRLLNVAANYCFPQTDSETDNASSKEVQWVSLTIRSNQYNDLVAVDGVGYGSTPVSIMLPIGVHQITVSKEGYKSFNQDLSIRRDHNLRAVLREKSNLPESGGTFADKLTDKRDAPTMVVIESGEYPIGTNGSKAQVRSFAIGQTPITVEQFGYFVEAANYQTDAEANKSCLQLSTTSDMSSMVNSNWRNPGFKQTADSPAVCISRDDVMAYADWVSNQTGFTYRLPSEQEWEIAARAGGDTAYWWGDEFGSSRANTGWSGTTWSNKSTSPVKTFSANAWGIYDTVGNVWEWTNSEQGMAKGGAWSFAPAKAQAHEFLFFNTDAGANFLGARLVREIN